MGICIILNFTIMLSKKETIKQKVDCDNLFIGNKTASAIIDLCMDEYAEYVAYKSFLKSAEINGDFNILPHTEKLLQSIFKDWFEQFKAKENGTETN
jgi:hypothetical protein